MIKKRTEHKIDPSELEITPFEMKRILGDTYEHLDVFMENIFCPDCKAPDRKKLVGYTPYLTRINDIVLKGKCAGCDELAARYIETGENREKYAVAEEIRANRKKK